MKKKSEEKSNLVNISKIYIKIYKFLIILPIIIFLFSIYVIYSTNQTEGMPIYRDVSLKGGVSAIVNVNGVFVQSEILTQLKNIYTENSFSISDLYSKGEKIGFIIDSDLNDEKLRESLIKIIKVDLVDGENYNSNIISPSLSNEFFTQAIKILLVSFSLMSIVIFLYFKKFVPSFAVVLSGFFDLIVTIAILDFFKISISIAGIGALLMLIGYSIDTDVLLTNRLVKEKGENYFAKTFDAFKTGSIMSLTTLLAGLIAVFVTNSPIIFQISLILVIGLIVDMISTWIQNTGILLWWLEKAHE